LPGLFSSLNDPPFASLSFPCFSATPPTSLHSHSPPPFFPSFLTVLYFVYRTTFSTQVYPQAEIFSLPIYSAPSPPPKTFGIFPPVVFFLPLPPPLISESISDLSLLLLKLGLAARTTPAWWRVRLSSVFLLVAKGSRILPLSSLVSNLPLKTSLIFFRTRRGSSPFHVVFFPLANTHPEFRCTKIRPLLLGFPSPPTSTCLFPFLFVHSPGRALLSVNGGFFSHLSKATPPFKKRQSTSMSKMHPLDLVRRPVFPGFPVSAHFLLEEALFCSEQFHFVCDPRSLTPPAVTRPRWLWKSPAFAICFMLF